jgi:hypothetical protein
MLVIGDDELSVRDNEDMLLEVAGWGAHVGRLGEVTWMGLDMEQNM